MNELQKAANTNVSKLDTSPGQAPAELARAAAAAEEQETAALAETDAGAFVHKLSEPLVLEGTAYEELTFRWEALTGADHLDIEGDLLARGTTLVVPEYTGGYLLGMAVRACMELKALDLRRRAAVLKALPLRDFKHICGEARSFLLRGERRPLGRGSGSNA